MYYDSDREDSRELFDPESSRMELENEQEHYDAPMWQDDDEEETICLEDEEDYSDDPVPMWEEYDEPPEFFQ